MVQNKTFIRAFITAVAAMIWATTCIAADDWPTKRPIRLIVPFDAGASADAVQRFFAIRLSQALGQQIIVENVGGAGGAIGAMKVVGSAPDGYTLLLGNTTTHATNIYLTKNMGYSPTKDFVAISLIDIGMLNIYNTIIHI